jgi:hypothetical protein
LSSFFHGKEAAQGLAPAVQKKTGRTFLFDRFLKTLETCFTSPGLRERPGQPEQPELRESPRGPVQAREPGPEPSSQPVSALRLSCTLRLQRITPRQKAWK